MIPRIQEEITAERKDQARQSTLYILLVFFLGFASYTNLKKKRKGKKPKSDCWDKQAKCVQDSKVHDPVFITLPSSLGMMTFS